MIKTPLTGMAVGLTLMALAPAAAAAAVSARSVDLHADAATSSVFAAPNDQDAGASPWSTIVGDPAAHNGVALDSLGGPAAGADALPLAQFAGAAAPPARSGFDVWDFINRVRYGGLPEPASWALMLVGFGMIGAALRGFVVANRRLERLKLDESREA